MFQKILDEERIERAPVLEVLKRQPKQIMLTALLRMPEQAPGYIFGAFDLHLRHAGARQLARFRAARPSSARPCSASSGSRFAGILVGSRRPQEHVHDRLRVHGRLRLRLFRACSNTRVPWLMFIAIARLVDAGDDTVRPGGGADRGELHAAAALQRRLDRLSACLGHRRRAFAVHRDVAVRDLSVRRWPIAIYILACAIIGIIATSLLTDYTNKEISAEYETV